MKTENTTTQDLADFDYDTATTILKQADSVLATIIDTVGECKLSQEQRKGDVFSNLCESIIYQQLSGKAAGTIHQRFLALYPNQFPTAQSILNTEDELLRSAGISRPKISYLKDLAAKTLAGLPILKELEEMDDEAVIKCLTEVKGVGRWTAQMFLIFRLYRLDVLPTDDLGLRAAVRKAYNLAHLPDKKTFESVGHKWKPYCTIASWYLWRSLDL